MEMLHDINETASNHRQMKDRFGVWAEAVAYSVNVDLKLLPVCLSNLRLHRGCQKVVLLDAIMLRRMREAFQICSVWSHH